MHKSACRAHINGRGSSYTLEGVVGAGGGGDFDAESAWVLVVWTMEVCRGEALTGEEGEEDRWAAPLLSGLESKDRRAAPVVRDSCSADDELGGKDMELVKSVRLLLSDRLLPLQRPFPNFLHHILVHLFTYLPTCI